MEHGIKDLLPFKAPEKFPEISGSWIGEEALIKLKKEIGEVFDERRIRITETSVEYLSEDSNETVLLGIYKDMKTETFRLEIGIHLDDFSTDKTKAATYDYQVFRAFLYNLSSTPGLLEDAVYSSWEEENRWNINRTGYTQVGDALVKYVGGSGCGYYYIHSATAE